MTREEFIKQRCEIDKITEEEFEETYRVVKCNCGMPYCKGYRCLDLDDLLKENKKLKNNWNELKEFIQKDYDFFGKLIDPKYGCAMGALSRVKDKVQELEQGVDSNE